MSEDSHAMLRATMFSTALNTAGFDDPMVITWETARRVMTEKRLEILDALGSDAEIDSHRGLARYLDRNKSDVQDDLDILYESGVIEREPGPANKMKPVLASETLVVNPILVNGKHLTPSANVMTGNEKSDTDGADTEAEAQP